MGALALLAITAAALQLPLWGWEVEDAGIDVAYARSFAEGFGLVPQVGAERVEGFSNPLWVLLLAAGTRVGLDGFVITRWLGLALGCATVPAVYAAMRPLASRLPHAPMVAAAAVAMYAPHAIWAQSGLENALFSLLLAAGCARVATDNDLDVLGPLAFLGVALTRPEGIMYGVIGAGAAIASANSWPAALRRTALWISLFAAPLALSELARIVYFGQELPATFHAKVGIPEQRVLDGTSRGWSQLMSFAMDTGTVVIVPLVAVGASGTADWRWLSAPASIVLILVTAITGSIWPVVVLLVALPLMAFDRKGPILAAAALLAVGCAFHVGAGGDWMRGYRWMSLVAVPGAMLVGVGVIEIAERWEAMRIPIVAAAGIAALPQALYVAKYARDPEVSPHAVVERLDHWLSVKRRLQIDRRIRIVDHDMGGMLTFGAAHAQIRDTRGLVDLPFALHGTDQKMVAHELFGDRPFDMAHNHGNTRVALSRHPEFRRQYVEIEGYGRSRSHKGQFLRRDLFLDPAGWTGPSLPITFAEGPTIIGLHVPSPEVGPGSGLYLEFGVDRGDRAASFRMIGFLTDGERVLASWDLPPAYDWLAPGHWRPGEVFHGRFSVAIPEDTPEGSAELGIVVLSDTGAVLPVQTATAPAFVPGAPVFAAGEVRIANLSEIVSREEMGRLALADKASALSAAAAGQCEAAEHAWNLALRHRTRSHQWRRGNRLPVAQSIARCYAARAAQGLLDGDSLLDRVRELEHARSWSPRTPEVWTHARQIGDIAHSRAVAAEDPATRFKWAEAAVRADPRRSWDRRLAESLR